METFSITCISKLARVAPPGMATKQWNHILKIENKKKYVYSRIFSSTIIFFLLFYFSVIDTRKSVIFEHLSKNTEEGALLRRIKHTSSLKSA